MLCDVRIFVISNKDKVTGTADLLWFEENDTFQLEISEKKYLTVSHLNSWTPEAFKALPLWSI